MLWLHDIESAYPYDSLPQKDQMNYGLPSPVSKELSWKSSRVFESLSVRGFYKVKKPDEMISFQILRIGTCQKNFST